MRLIDADKFGEDLMKLWDYSCDEGVSAIAVLKQALLALNNAPTVEPVKQCKYCKYCGNEDYCSNCHSDHSLFEYYERPQRDMLPVGTTFNIKPEDIKWNGGDKKETTFDDYLKEQLKDPEFRKEYEKLCDEDKQKGDKNNGTNNT